MHILNIIFMAHPGKGKYTKEDQALARLAKAISHPARVAIVRYLASHETSSFSEISDEIPLAASTVSQHMSELKGSGLIQSHLEHPKIIYRIDSKNWKLARRYFKEFLRIKAGKTKSR